MPSTGKSLRLARLSRHADGRFLFVPLDHSVSDGPITTTEKYAGLVRAIVDGGADAIVVHKGRMRQLPARLMTRCATVLHLSASTAHAPDRNSKVLVGDVEEAVQLGCDGVSVHVNIGSDTEASQLRDLGRVAAACERWGMPLLAMAYPRGPRITEPGDPALVAHVVNIAADLGVDLVKTVLTSPPARMAEVVANAPVPVVVAGGESAGSGLLAMASAAMDAGCRGLAVGRGVFTSPDPRRTVRELASLVHGTAPISPSRPAVQATTEMAGVL